MKQEQQSPYRHWPRILRHSLHRPRLAFAALLFAVLLLVLPSGWDNMVRWLLSFDGATFAFLIAAARMMAQATPETMRYHAVLEDEGKWAVLALSALAAFAVLVALMLEKASAKHVALEHLTLAMTTIILAWMFINTIFALHYAHDFYSSRETTKHGLIFPATEHPDYWDFIYFAFVLGMTFQVSDVQITSQRLRRLATFHGTLAFFFNVFILALSVNIIAGAL
jgi:uncharacterized membrane protein